MRFFPRNKRGGPSLVAEARRTGDGGRGGCGEGAEHPRERRAEVVERQAADEADAEGAERRDGRRRGFRFLRGGGG